MKPFWLFHLWPSPLKYIKQRKRKIFSHVPNPDYIDMYVKNWFIRNACIPVFSKRLKKEIILLHSEHCWEGKKFCTEILNILIQVRCQFWMTMDYCMDLQKKSDSVRSDGSICWLAVRGLQLGKMDWYQII